jgi:hypothetical protein
MAHHNSKAKIKTLLIFFIAILPSLAFASAQPVIEFDVNNPSGSIDSAQLDNFIEASDKNPVQFFESDGTGFIASNKPIEHNEYKPTYLSDLGFSIHADKAGTSQFIEKSSSFSLTRNSLKAMPEIPEMVFDHFENASPQASSNTQQVNTHPERIAAAAGIPVLYSENIYHTEPVLALLMLLLGLGGLSVMILRQGAKRDAAQPVNAQIKPAAKRVMVGAGNMFEFTNPLQNLKNMPENTSFVNLLWNSRKFTNENDKDSVHTYFYMTFYMPNQQGYAAPLQNKKASADQKTPTNA